MYRLTRTKDPSVLEITFDYIEPIGVDPFHDILLEYASETGIQPKTVDFLFNYKFTEDGHSMQFYWNSGFTVYIFYISKAQYNIVYDRLSGICARLNRLLGEKHYFAKHGKYPNTK